MGMHYIGKVVINVFEMKEEYKLGIPLIDEQHARLFEIGESAYQLLKDEFSEDKYDRIVAIINELKDYTVVHFADEEKYMESINYKRLFSQKFEHAEFIKKVNEVDFSKIDTNQEEYIMGILTFLSDWLVSHIIEKDLQIVGR